MRDEYITKYRKWKKAAAPLSHINHLMKSPLVAVDTKCVLAAEYRRLWAIQEPLRLAVTEVSERQKREGTWFK